MLLQLGDYMEKFFYDFTITEAQPSFWIDWPTNDKPSNRYKYASIEFNMNTNLMNWNRTTYSILDWLGDIGGLFGMLYSLGTYFVAPWADYRLQSTLMSKFFRFRESLPDTKFNQKVRSTNQQSLADKEKLH